MITTSVAMTGCCSQSSRSVLLLHSADAHQLVVTVTLIGCVSAGVIFEHAGSLWMQLAGIGLRVSPFLASLDLYAVQRRPYLSAGPSQPMSGQQPLFDSERQQDTHGPHDGDRNYSIYLSIQSGSSCTCARLHL